MMALVEPGESSHGHHEGASPQSSDEDSDDSEDSSASSSAGSSGQGTPIFGGRSGSEIAARQSGRVSCKDVWKTSSSSNLDSDAEATDNDPTTDDGKEGPDEVDASLGTQAMPHSNGRVTASTSSAIETPFFGKVIPLGDGQVDTDRNTEGDTVGSSSAPSQPSRRQTTWSDMLLKPSPDRRSNAWATAASDTESSGCNDGDICVDNMSEPDATSVSPRLLASRDSSAASLASDSPLKFAGKQGQDKSGESKTETIVTDRTKTTITQEAIDSTSTLVRDSDQSMPEKTYTGKDRESRILSPSSLEAFAKSRAKVAHEQGKSKSRKTDTDHEANISQPASLEVYLRSNSRITLETGQAKTNHSAVDSKLAPRARTGASGSSPKVADQSAKAEPGKNSTRKSDSIEAASSPGVSEDPVKTASELQSEGANLVAADTGITELTKENQELRRRIEDMERKLASTMLSPGLSESSTSRESTFISSPSKVKSISGESSPSGQSAVARKRKTFAARRSLAGGAGYPLQPGQLREQLTGGRRAATPTSTQQSEAKSSWQSPGRSFAEPPQIVSDSPRSFAESPQILSDSPRCFPEPPQIISDSPAAPSFEAELIDVDCHMHPQVVAPERSPGKGSPAGDLETEKKGIVAVDRARKSYAARRSVLQSIAPEQNPKISTSSHKSPIMTMANMSSGERSIDSGSHLVSTSPKAGTMNASNAKMDAGHGCGQDHKVRELGEGSASWIDRPEIDSAFNRPVVKTASSSYTSYGVRRSPSMGSSSRGSSTATLASEQHPQDASGLFLQSTPVLRSAPVLWSAEHASPKAASSGHNKARLSYGARRRSSNLVGTGGRTSAVEKSPCAPRQSYGMRRLSQRASSGCVEESVAPAEDCQSSSKVSVGASSSQLGRRSYAARRSVAIEAAKQAAGMPTKSSMVSVSAASQASPNRQQPCGMQRSQSVPDVTRVEKIGGESSQSGRQGAIWQWNRASKGAPSWVDYTREDSGAIEQRWQRFVTGDASCEEFVLLVQQRFANTIKFDADHACPGGSQTGTRGCRRIQRKVLGDS